MDKFEFQPNQVFKCRCGEYGTVDSFNGKPHMIIFPKYSSLVSKYDGPKNRTRTEKGKQYDIIALYDGSSIDDPKKVFSKRFKPEGLELLWQDPEFKEAEEPAEAK